MQSDDELTRKLIENRPQVARHFLRQTYGAEYDTDLDLIIAALKVIKLHRRAMLEKDRMAVQYIRYLLAEFPPESPSVSQISSILDRL